MLFGAGCYGNGEMDECSLSVLDVFKKRIECILSRAFRGTGPVADRVYLCGILTYRAVMRYRGLGGKML